MIKSKQVVILAGGEGTRLKAISGDTPKSMVLVNSKPVLLHLIEQCIKYGFIDIRLLVSFGSNNIKRYFGDGSNFGVSIEYSNDSTLKGTAGALLDVIEDLDDYFLVLYGDTYFEINLNKIWNFHRLQSSDATLFVHPNDHPYDSDLVELDDNFRIKTIHKYPHDKHWRRNLVNAAVYVFTKSALSGIKPPVKKMDIAKELFPLMIKNGNKLYGYMTTEYIKDMGTPDRLESVKHDISSGKVSKLNYSCKKKAVFLDRDGVINHEVGHLSSTKQFKLIDGVSDAIRLLNRAGFITVVVTNQPIIARGILSCEGLRIIHNKMETLLGNDNAYIDKIYYCPHHPDSGFKGEINELKVDCSCRKPEPGLLLRASEELNLSLDNSWIVGDRTADILAGSRVDMSTILVKTGFAGKDEKYRIKPNFIATDLSEAVDLILNGKENDY
jgi:D,D-heptose 1,7-bisphosphate phosphatase